MTQIPLTLENDGVTLTNLTESITSSLNILTITEQTKLRNIFVSKNNYNSRPVKFADFWTQICENSRQTCQVCDVTVGEMWQEVVRMESINQLEVAKYVI